MGVACILKLNTFSRVPADGESSGQERNSHICSGTQVQMYVPVKTLTRGFKTMQRIFVVFFVVFFKRYFVGIFEGAYCSFILSSLSKLLLIFILRRYMLFCSVQLSFLNHHSGMALLLLSLSKLLVLH